MKYIFLLLCIFSVMAADAQRGKRIKKAVKHIVKRIEKSDTIPATGIPYEPPPPIPVPTEPPANLDSIIINTLKIRIRDIAYLTANVELNDRDSSTYNRLRVMRDAVRLANPTNWNTVVTLDSLPGEWVVRVYEHLRLLVAGKLEELDPGTLNAVRGKTQLKYWFDEIDAQFPPSYINDRNTGRYILLDQ